MTNYSTHNNHTHLVGNTMSDNNSTTFGYASMWAKKRFANSLQEYDLLDDGIMMSGSVGIPANMAEELANYLLDPANMTEYGVKLDLALFFKEEGKVQITGKLTTPYVKSDDTKNPSTISAKRKVR